MTEIISKIKAILSRPKTEENKFTLSRYGLVSLTSFTLGTLTLWLLTDKARWYYLLSGIVGAIVSIAADFVLNEIWTFSHRKHAGFSSPNLVKRFLKYLVSKLIGLAIALMILAVGTQVFRMHYLISNLMGIFVSFLWNYAMSYTWVWAQNKCQVRN